MTQPDPNTYRFASGIRRWLPSARWPLLILSMSLTGVAGANVESLPALDEAAAANSTPVRVETSGGTALPAEAKVSAPSAGAPERLFNPQVLALYDAYETHRNILRTGGWPRLSAVRTLQEGDTGPQVAVLRERLQRSGDLAVSGAVDVTYDVSLFDTRLAEAVMAFQTRHGLLADGVVGARTRAALNVSAAERMRQLAVNVQRWNALPTDFDETFVLVNLPEFELQLYRAGDVELSMRVVVGKQRNPTPTMVQALDRFVLNPTWFVPQKIGARELLPKVQANPAYLSEQGFDVYRGKQRQDPESISWESLQTRGFEYSFRQRPGPGNSLGRVKFLLPNPRNIYLHDTPHKNLFASPQRAFSHGCVRLERPLEFAKALLMLQPGWTEASVARQLRAQRTVHVRLDQPLPVYLSYLTAKIDQGKVWFFEDVYGHDKAPLEQAVLPSDVVATLAQVRGYRRALRQPKAEGGNLLAMAAAER